VTGDIYNDGTYVRNNPSLHEEDSEYKFFYIKQLLDEIRCKNDRIKILDVGGGGGNLGLMVCRYFLERKITPELTALDQSLEMLSIQKARNPYITRTVNAPLQSLMGDKYDLVLMIDVIEHIQDREQAAQQLDALSKNVIYNIPTEINLADLMRNIYVKGKYYHWQTAALGHIHFFSARSALAFIRKKHQLKKWIFPDYCSHVLTSPFSDYAAQRKNKLRMAELSLSRYIYKYFRFFAPYLIQGSVFCLVCGGLGKT